MAKFEIRFALGGGFGGCENEDWEEIDADDEAEASDFAWESACRLYESYEGSNGLRDISQIMEEEDVSPEDAEMIYSDEREGWLDYEVRPVAGKETQEGSVDE